MELLAQRWLRGRGRSWMEWAMGWPDRKWTVWRRQERLSLGGKRMAPCARMMKALIAKNRKWTCPTRKMALPRRWAHGKAVWASSDVTRRRTGSRRSLPVGETRLESPVGACVGPLALEVGNAIREVCQGAEVTEV